MSVIVGFTIVVMILMLGYMAYRLFLRKQVLTLVSLCMQIFALTIAVICFIKNVQSTNWIEACYIAFGVAIPGVFFGYDYGRMMKKVRDNGVYQGFVEPVVREDENTVDIRLNKKQINPIIKERQVPELVKDLNLNKDDILKNMKKSLTQAQVFLNNSDYDNAYEIYNTLIKLVKNCPNLYYNHGNICYSRGDYAGAVQSYKTVLEMNETLIEELSSPKEVFQVSKSKRDSCLNAPKTAEEIRYEEFMIYFNLGNTKFKLNRFQQAIEAYKKSLELNPNLEEANENIARALIAQEHVDEAIDYYKKVVDGDLSNYRVHYIIGNLYFEIKKYTLAVEELKECIRLNSMYAEAYEQLGNVLCKIGKHKEAIDYYKKYVKLMPDNYKGFYNLGTTLFQTGMAEKAVENFKKVIEIKPDNYKSYYNMAVALDEMGNQEEAIGAFKKVIELKPDFIDAYNNLGIILSTQGRHLEALEIYVRGLKKNPEEHSMYYNMGITLSDMERYEDAADAYKNALEIKPDELEIYYHLGVALTELKKYNEAIEAYKNALKVKPADSELFYSLAATYSMIKKHDIAMDNLKRAIELNQELKYEARTNKAFDSLRSKSEFRELVS